MTAWYAIHEDGHILVVHSSTDGDGFMSLVYRPDAPGRWSLVGNVGQVRIGNSQTKPLDHRT
jgi:hypothetical protein